VFRTRAVLFVKVFLVLALVASLAGCGGGSALNPQFQPQVSNVADNFQFQTTGITNITQTLHYTWQDSGTAASINQACSITGGTATLSLLDANGTQVYSASLANNGTFQTSPVGSPVPGRLRSSSPASVERSISEFRRCKETAHATRI